MPKTRRSKVLNPKEILKTKLLELFSDRDENNTELNDVPQKWEKHGDLILLPSSSFRKDVWLQFGDKLWDIVAEALNANRVARKSTIQNDDFRSPRVELLKGEDSWVTHIDNKIKYTFDVTKCMFSSGNISEKLRIAKFCCEGETIVDLYAGIGYFTLPFIIHAKAELVHACEWNPHAAEALEKNLILNKVREKCVIHFGDNRQVCPEKVADRVNLGLIPSSESGWETACRALKPSGGILHVHGNVISNMKSKTIPMENNKCNMVEWTEWAEHVRCKIETILSDLYHYSWLVEVLNINHIKSYAPHIDHLVVDINCKCAVGQ
ncbi:tRNA wybutosine-synthesizing protein 2 homolog [Uloborus diversus]|uniref:tRNA wybutosine-synthesizing protein 2 homolog n=1 Tax=Uloborus diversus TaxID=327109 RepID=UPI00240A75C9|nr:tRNA wybutosine-synthesizing protein 2 homolog [Uloborus diversus]